jgi:general stress protein YciG
METNVITQSNTISTKKDGKSRRGFASMDKSRHKLVSSKGGKAVRTNYPGRNLDPAPGSTHISPVGN